MANNSHILQNAFSHYHKNILNEVEKRCRVFCEKLCISAVQAREAAPRKHNFTGNLLNSIAVCLYKNGNPRDSWYSQEIIAPSKSRKMTYPNHYAYKDDYEGAVSRYNPEVTTDRQWGEGDAIRFFRSFRPEGRNVFDIIVAYTTEYSEWVEKERGTTGILQTYDFAGSVGVQFLQLPTTHGGFINYN